MRGSSSHSRRRQLDGLADAHVGHTSTETPGHYRVDVLVGWIGVVLQQGGGLHDLSRLAVAALRNLQFDPGDLQRMAALRIEPLDRRHLGAGHRSYRGDTGTSGATVHMHGAGAAQPNPTTKFCSREADLIADRPQQRRVIGRSNGNGAAIEIELGHDRTPPDDILTVKSPDSDG